MRNLSILLFILVGLLSLGCNTETQREEDRRLIREYLEANNLEANSLPSGLYYSIIAPGGNVNPGVQNLVEVRYEGQLLDGSVFDATEGNATRQFPLGNLIVGWQIGLPLIGRGGEIRLYVPSDLGYGVQERPGIPASSVLIFDIELVDFE